MTAKPGPRLYRKQCIGLSAIAAGFIFCHAEKYVQRLLPDQERICPHSGRSCEAQRRVGGYLYVHRSAKCALSDEEAKAARQARLHLPQTFNWLVLKVEQRNRKQVSFLDYEDFDQSSFPALRRSCTVDIGSRLASVREYSSSNPPILHRKELLLAFGDPRRRKFSALTKRLEDLGLFKDMHRMGHRRAWEEALRMAGLEMNFFELPKNMVKQ